MTVALRNPLASEPPRAVQILEPGELRDRCLFTWALLSLVAGRLARGVTDSPEEFVERARHIALLSFELRGLARLAPESEAVRALLRCAHRVSLIADAALRDDSLRAGG